jgi:hypothetical protein
MVGRISGKISTGIRCIPNFLAPGYGSGFRIRSTYKIIESGYNADPDTQPWMRGISSSHVPVTLFTVQYKVHKNTGTER